MAKNVLKIWICGEISPNLVTLFMLNIKNSSFNIYPQSVWPDWAIYWPLGNFSKPVATINLPNYSTFLGNFCKCVKIFNFSSEIILGQHLRVFTSHTALNTLSLSTTEREIEPEKHLECLYWFLILKALFLLSNEMDSHFHVLCWPRADAMDKF